MHPLLRLALALPPHLKVLVAALLLVALTSALLSTAFALIGLYGFLLRFQNPRKRREALLSLGITEGAEDHRRVVGFFHPYCNAGGGGERVLWEAISCLQKWEKDVVCLVYTGDAVDVGKEEMVLKAKNRFGITVNPDLLILVPLRTRYLVEDGTWRVFALLGQSLGSMWLALEGLRTGLIPDVWIDSMGYAFAYPLVRKLGRIPIGSYTHYPTITPERLQQIHQREIGHTNTAKIAKSTLLTYVKLFYYLIFAELYSPCLRQANVMMVNSTWTRGHIDHWLRPFGYRDDHVFDEPQESTASTPSSSTLRQRRPNNSREEKQSTSTTFSSHSRATTVYPPCNTAALSALPLELRENVILSVAQFRPEKEHEVQLLALRKFFDRAPEFRTGPNRLRLVMAGSVRNEEDETRVDGLRALARKLEIEDSVEFAVNVPYSKLVELFGTASIGMHTMVDEHFGITVVEFMAAGLIPLVHASAGPLLDIVVPYDSQPTGFHATTAETFADRLHDIMSMDDASQQAMRPRARANATERFSEAVFEKGWRKAWEQLKAVKRR